MTKFRLYGCNHSFKCPDCGVDCFYQYSFKDDVTRYCANCEKEFKYQDFLRNISEHCSKREK